MVDTYYYPIERRTPILHLLPIEVFDDMRSNLVKDRSQFYKDLAVAFYGANREGAKVSN